MEKLSDRVRAIRKKLGMNSQKELADVLGCSDGKIKGWEQDTTKSMKSSDIITLTTKYGFSEEWLETGKGDMMVDKDALLLENISSIDNMLNKNLTFPFLKDIHASAGYGALNGYTDRTNITLSRDMIPSDSKDLEAIRVSGNSMSPTIDDEDVIFIDKKSIEPIDGKIFVVYLCEEVYVKRLFIEPKTKEIILNSDNAIFPQLKADCDDFRIIGKVIANMKISKL